MAMIPRRGYRFVITDVQIPAEPEQIGDRLPGGYINAAEHTSFRQPYVIHKTLRNYAYH